MASRVPFALLRRLRASASSVRLRRCVRLQVEQLEDRRVLSANQAYVAYVYRDLMSRAADPVGLVFWTNQLDQGLPRARFARALDKTADYFAGLVKTDYRQYLLREPDQAGLNFWVGQLQNGATDEQVLAGLLATPEYYQLAAGSQSPGTDRQWVNFMYLYVLNRNPVQSEIDYWTGQLAAGTSRIGVALSFTTSSEHEDGLLLGVYQRYLNRTPAASEVDWWETYLDQNGYIWEDTVAAFVGCDEYFKRATS